MNIKCRYVIILAVTFVISGCNQQTYNKHQYALDVRRPEAAASQTDLVLEVDRFHIDSSFDTKELLYRTSQFEYKGDYYNELLTPPAQMVADITRNWMANTGLFTQTVRSDNSSPNSLVLKGDILSFYGDKIDNSDLRGTVEIRMFLLSRKGRDESLLFSKTYKVSSSWDNPTPQGLVKALNTSMEMILKQTESDLRKVLAENRK